MLQKEKTMTLRNTLLQNKPKLQPLEINGTTYYLRTMTVGDMNRQIFEFRNWLIKQAEMEGIELPAEDDEHFDDALDQFGAKYRLQQSLASRICDENGELLFNPFEMEDLNAIAQLDSEVVMAFNKAVDSPKDSTNAENSN